MGHWDSATIVRAADMLGRRKIQSAVPKLLSLLDEPDIEIQNAAIKALGEIGASQEIHKIIKLVDKEETRLTAITALGKIGDPEAENVLIKYINSSDNSVRIYYIKALKNFHSPVVKMALIELLQNSSYGQVEIYWDFDDTKRDEFLFSIFDSLTNKISIEDISILTKLLDTEESTFLIGIIKLLDKIHDESTLLHILNLTRNDSEYVSSAAYSALEKFEVATDIHEKLEQLSSGDEDKYLNSINFFGSCVVSRSCAKDW